MNAHGIVHKYPDNVDTDVIIPARYLNTPNAQELARHCMEDIDAGFIDRVQTGDIMVAGWNFGCGSSREHAPLAIKTAGVSCVIAKTFARIFYRNSINIGLPILECEAASDAIAAGDEVSVDFDTGVITNLTKGETYQAEPFPAFIQEIISKGGLMNSLKG
ncbi:MAG: 3-isopropylmalate dehydratase small subunit [Oscillospiraceae bacterium]|nr:3-isopropylmalate dehydratase small subunit [Oscillospiraceae bacterium]